MLRRGRHKKIGSALCPAEIADRKTQDLRGIGVRPRSKIAQVVRNGSSHGIIRGQNTVRRVRSDAGTGPVILGKDARDVMACSASQYHIFLIIAAVNRDLAANTDLTRTKFSAEFHRLN